MCVHVCGSETWVGSEHGLRPEAPRQPGGFSAPPTAPQSPRVPVLTLRVPLRSSLLPAITCPEALCLPHKNLEM